MTYQQKAEYLRLIINFRFKSHHVGKSEKTGVNGVLALDRSEPPKHDFFQPLETVRDKAETRQKWRRIKMLDSILFYRKKGDKEEDKEEDKEVDESSDFESAGEMEPCNFHNSMLHQFKIMKGEIKVLFSKYGHLTFVDFL